MCNKNPRVVSLWETGKHHTLRMLFCFYLLRVVKRAENKTRMFNSIGYIFGVGMRVQGFIYESVKQCVGGLKSLQ
jgi:hypothetical protein